MQDIVVNILKIIGKQRIIIGKRLFMRRLIVESFNRLID